VYPADANLIVSLLDIHPPINPEDHIINGPFEIFEAGTGHGALTLYLARAIHGLNSNPPSLPPRKPFHNSSTDKPKLENPGVSDSNQATASTDESPTGALSPKSLDVSDSNQLAQLINKLYVVPGPNSVEEARYEAYLPTRRAVVHTLDISRSKSNFARKIVLNFRRGLYYHNIDFHVGKITEYLSSRLASTPEPFLEHAILDLPGPEEHLEIIGQALKPNGSLIVFCPSITQIVECLRVIREKQLPYFFESTLELGAGIGVGGREWDVRVTKPRARLRAEAEASEEEQIDAVSEPYPADDEENLSTAGESNDSDWVTVCRPKVGDKVYGGGFLGLWRRKKPASPQDRELQLLYKKQGRLRSRS
jgi:tRNA (adenine57-N1/adenine58-N1)-methyltransferase catalytic subunit